MVFSSQRRESFFHPSNHRLTLMSVSNLLMCLQLRFAGVGWGSSPFERDRSAFTWSHLDCSVQTVNILPVKLSFRILCKGNRNKKYGHTFFLILSFIRNEIFKIYQKRAFSDIVFMSLRSL